MKKITLLLIVFGILISSQAFAQEHDFTQTKKLIDSGISCNKLTNEQLEEIGDYYMEQMHPGESHELMDNMMGGEGSESLKQVHINMAKRLYCKENVYIGYGMMGSGGMRNMMGGSMMGNYPLGYGYSNYGYWNIFWILIFAAAIFLIVWIVYKFGIKNEPSSETPLGILKKRFAEGKITKKRYDEMKKELI
ncbi:MAG TPA: hypothetical protein VI564_02155 [Candidatus Nanoarchaeia archaeon]|nr:hypothetical protein [Candidatus Nanoarchaeia archaeon]